MPLYPYRCTQCGHRFEKIQKFDDEPEKICPQCGGALERPLTVPALQFKGAGWYVNDYAAKSGSVDADSRPAENKAAPETKSASGANTGAASAAAPTVAPATAASGSAPAAASQPVKQP